ncbi:MAG: TonB-dependent hemoglobin/transferrin/lactoferrin family receptor [Burkholderiales bacterium]|nr:TonB-dependent hemoglobin/transferrin/lactoferrin family receptor [Burkholderiales bacterium]
MHCKKPIAIALAMAWGAFAPWESALAQQAVTVSSDAEPKKLPQSGKAASQVQLKEITVTATRTSREADDVPATLTQISAQDLERKSARDLKDLLSDELDVSVKAAPPRFTATGSASGRAGNESVNIRGLEGNQVLMMVDGVRLPNNFSFGAFATGRGDFLEMGSLQGVDILRGASSTQYGSDGLAGAVSFRTLMPSDVLLADGKNKHHAGYLRSGYSSVDRAWSGTVTGAAQQGAWQSLIVLNTRNGHESRNHADAQSEADSLTSKRTAPNPVDFQSQAVLAKVLLQADAEHQFGMSIDAQQRRQKTEVISARSPAPLSATSVLDLDADDQNQRSKLAFQHRYEASQATQKNSWLQRAETQVYTQHAMVQQRSYEDRNTAADRVRDNQYRSNVLGISSLMESRFPDWQSQRLSYGFDWSRSMISAVRDGTVPPYGESFPTKPFPDTRYTMGGAFVQSEIDTAQFSVIPALRFDHYQLQPSALAYTGGAITKLSDHALTPRLGVIWRATTAFAPYAQIARGFRAPAPDQVNNGFTNLASGYSSIGNPNLKAEHADSKELGVRGQIGGLKYALTAFDNRYDNFISQQVIKGVGTPANPLIFQFINLSQAQIRGVEARAQWQIDEHWMAHVGVSRLHGESEINGKQQALDSINPGKLILGLRYEGAQFGGQISAQHHATKARSDIASVGNPPSPAFAPPAYTVVNLSAYCKLGDRFSLTARLDNAFDRKYWRWSDVRGIADTSPIKDAYTSAGRQLQLSAQYSY